MDVGTVRYEALAPVLNERTRRLWAAAEAEAVGHGGMRWSRARPACRGRGSVEELRSPLDAGRTRRAGGGRKRIVERAGLDLELLEPITAGEPDDSPLRWTSKSVSAHRRVAGAGAPGGSSCGQRVAAPAYTLGEPQEHRRRPTPGSGCAVQLPQRAGAQCSAAGSSGHFGRYVGEFKNGGREWPKGDPEQVKVHDFVIPEQGKAIPYGVYGAATKAGSAWGSITTRPTSP